MYRVMMMRKDFKRKGCGILFHVVVVCIRFVVESIRFVEDCKRFVASRRVRENSESIYYNMCVCVVCDGFDDECIGGYDDEKRF